jgi:hypothetical protein
MGGYGTSGIGQCVPPPLSDCSGQPLGFAVWPSRPCAFSARSRRAPDSGDSSASSLARMGGRGNRRADLLVRASAPARAQVWHGFHAGAATVDGGWIRLPDDRGVRVPCRAKVGFPPPSADRRDARTQRWRFRFLPAVAREGAFRGRHPLKAICGRSRMRWRSRRRCAECGL